MIRRRHGFTIGSNGEPRDDLFESFVLVDAAEFCCLGNTAAGTGAETQFTSGLGSYFSVLHYHISEFFREQPKGVVWVGIFAQASYTGAEAKTIQDFASG